MVGQCRIDAICVDLFAAGEVLLEPLGPMEVSEDLLEEPVLFDWVALIEREGLDDGVPFLHHRPDQGGGWLLRGASHPNGRSRSDFERVKLPVRKFLLHNFITGRFHTRNQAISAESVALLKGIGRHKQMRWGG